MASLTTVVPSGRYLEAIEDDARCNFQFDMTGGSGKCPYITGPYTNDIQNIVQDILGYTNPTGDGSRPYLDRTVPRTHPKCPYLYAQRIASMIGKGSGTATRVAPTQPADPSIGANPMCEYLQYPQYEIMVEFASRPYPIIDNNAFTKSITDGYWYKKNGTGEAFTYSPEWVRYCDYDIIPQDNTIQGQVGSIDMWGVGAVPTPFTSPPWMWLPDQILKVRWYQVPYRFITSSNSYIAGTPNRNWRGRINQNPWWNWPAGSLLYMSYNVTKYSPPTNDIGYYGSYLPTQSNPSNRGTIINYERLCDIELTFLLTNRYKSGSLGGTVTNGNYVQAGHNLLPSLGDGKFYYGTRRANGAAAASIQNPPAWFSFPVEVLFTDPDGANGPTTGGDN